MGMFIQLAIAHAPGWEAVGKAYKIGTCLIVHFNPCFEEPGPQIDGSMILDFLAAQLAKRLVLPVPFRALIDFDGFKGRRRWHFCGGRIGIRKGGECEGYNNVCSVKAVTVVGSSIRAQIQYLELVSFK